MYLLATKRFCSTVFGNVNRGDIINTDDHKARQLISAGLAEKYEDPGSAKQSTFQQPVEADQAGLSLPADQVSQPATVSTSADGESAQKVTYRTPKSAKSAKSRS